MTSIGLASFFNNETAVGDSVKNMAIHPDNPNNLKPGTYSLYYKVGFADETEFELNLLPTQVVVITLLSECIF